MRRLTITGRRLSALFVASLAFGGAGCATGDTASVGDIDSALPDVSDDGGDSIAVDTGDAVVETGDGKCHTDGDCAHDPNGTACDTTSGKCVQCVPSKDWCPDGTYCDPASNSCKTGCRTSLDCVATPTTDAGAPDAASDTGTADSGSSDAGKSDAGDAGDAGKSDASTSDATADAVADVASDAGSSDSGAAPLVCDPTSHQCVGCTDSSQCPLGSLCDVTTNSCYAGCTPTHGCPGTFSCCSGTCVDLNVSTADCGSCGKACPKVLNGAAACTMGTCVIGTCAAGTSDCNGNFDDGCEVNTTNDPANCGGCKDACSTVHGTPSCAASKCGIKCDPGYSDCDTDVTNGCETNTQTDVGHCGTCATVCAKLNDTPACNSGTCVVASCDTGYGNCDFNPANGCEANLDNDTVNCGKCNSPCFAPNGTPACTAGKCSIASCKTGYGDCNADPSDGCETDLNKSGTNCGKCGTICSATNGTATCASGACAILSCSGTYADCNKLVSDGCEVNLTNDPNHCGGCATVCNGTNGTPSCAASVCKVVACNAGFANCDGLAANGCEVNSTNDGNNCGACGNKCSNDCTTNVTATTCAGSSCKVTACTSGWYDVDSTCGNGCECQQSAISTSCSAATVMGTGPLALGTSVPVTANLVNSNDAYYQVTFASNTDVTFHPKITLTGTGLFSFEVLNSACGATTSCTDGPASGLNASAGAVWEEYYFTSHVSVPPPSVPNPSGTDAPGFATITVGTANTVWIHVYRPMGSKATCDNFTLTASN